MGDDEWSDLELLPKKQPVAVMMLKAIFKKMCIVTKLNLRSFGCIPVQAPVIHDSSLVSVEAVC